MFATLVTVTPEQRFSQLRNRAALGNTLSRDEVSDLIAITATLFQERLNLRQRLDRIRYDFKSLRTALNDLDATVGADRAPRA